MRTITDSYRCQATTNVHHGRGGAGVTLRAIELGGGEGHILDRLHKVVAVRMTPDQAEQFARYLCKAAQEARATNDRVAG